MNVAIVGRPNVGKSALFNRLVGRNIAIVHDQPGITRDRIAAESTKGARPFMVWDTGGIVGAGESQLTRDVHRVVEDAMAESDLLVFVVDGKQGITPMDEELARVLRKTRKPVLLVVNKIDNDKQEADAAEFDSLGFDHVISISAAHGRGMSELLEKIDSALPADDKKPKPSAKSVAPLAIAIVGRPNVGKSSLINAIVQRERAIVSEIAGTTRDAVDILYERGDERFVFIDTAGIRRRGAHSSSVEVFSVMRAERSIRRADLCVLVIDVTSGVTAQDKRIAGLIQKAGKPCIVVVNKWDLVRPKFGRREAIGKLVERTRAEMFFLDYAPILVSSAQTGENVERLFRLMEQTRGAARRRIGTGVLNRLMRAAFAANPPPMARGKRLKLFYVAQASGEDRDSTMAPPEFVLFVNDVRLLSDTYRRYLEGQLRAVEPYPALPVRLTLRPRSEKRTG